MRFLLSIAIISPGASEAETFNSLKSECRVFLRIAKTIQKLYAERLPRLPFRLKRPPLVFLLSWLAPDSLMQWSGLPETVEKVAHGKHAGVPDNPQRTLAAAYSVRSEKDYVLRLFL